MCASYLFVNHFLFYFFFACCVQCEASFCRPLPACRPWRRARTAKWLLRHCQGHRCSQKKRFLKKFFKQSQKQGLQKIFFWRFPLEENKKRSTQIFCEVSGAFQQNFNGSKNNAVLEPRTGQFSRT